MNYLYMISMSVLFNHEAIIEDTSMQFYIVFVARKITTKRKDGYILFCRVYHDERLLFIRWMDI